jgi:transcription elongation factor GreA
MEVAMNSPLVVGQRRSELSGHVEHRLRDELAVLRAQRDQLRGDGAEDHRAADAGDRAEAMRRADDVFRIEDRIGEINRLLVVGTGVWAARAEGGALAEGSTVTLRFPDGEEETFYASSVLDTAPEDAQIELLGLDSPLAKALAGHTAGDTISWVTPAGSHQADVVKIQPADHSAADLDAPTHVVGRG